MNLNEIQDLIKFVSKSGVSEVEIEQKDFKIVIKAENKTKKEEHTVYVQAPQQQVQFQAPAAAQAPVAAAPVAPTTPAVPVSDDAKYITVKSPMIGTFYRATSPDKPALANVGDTISKGQVVCIIEAMKLFNDIESEVSGKIVKVLVDDATPVEYDQPLFLVDPA
ncbi:MAG: acetyl-CoA carboxylase biotin carboxyl carrier protein [Crocinitomicaceae bacterium]|jgi:acetyl-CoA carboxylase biotin carboxyl carrier protein|nr:acetyl-CoA carboxylase biotin carboxyl carrier protein [Crocinitomicaceae bacterium]